MRGGSVRLISLLALLLGCTAVAAQASGTTVIAAVKAQDKVVKSSAAYRGLKHIKANTPAEARKLVTEFKALQGKVEHAATAVSRASASGPRQKQGQEDWVQGVRELARGLGQLDTGLQDVVNGKTAAAKAALTKAERTLSAANARGSKGDKLLGLPTND